MMIQLIEAKPSAKELLPKLRRWFARTRFILDGWSSTTKARSHRELGGGRFKGGDIRIPAVRLFCRKHYHGNGPSQGPPMQRCGWTRKRAAVKVSFLEGGDWVHFNDLLNDFLDHHNVSADVRSKAAIIRKGRRRRVVYSRDRHNTDQWMRTGRPEHYVNCVGHFLVPFSTYPDSTPGLYRPLQPIKLPK